MAIFYPCKQTIISVILGMVFVSLSTLNSSSSSCWAQQQELGAHFVFGDSLVDVGNNNYIVSLSKANYVPNGVDFGRPTGRFTNGRTIVDIVGQELGLKEYTPAYLAPSTRGSVILQGVNYGSGGGGILNETGKVFVGRINLDAQLDNFANTKQEIISNIGEAATKELLNKKALFWVTMGSNDFINNYLQPPVFKLKQPLLSPEAFINLLVSRLRLQLTRLYKMGARKIIVVNVGPIGCIPYVRDMNPLSGDDCVAYPNQLAQAFNLRLRSLVSELSSLEGSKFVYADAYRIVNDILFNYPSYGFENANAACCYGSHIASGRHGGLIPCGPTSKYCVDRSKFVFWDPYHPSDAANQLIASRLMDGGVDDISPINIRQLVDS